MASALLGTDLDLLNKRTGKVRDLYDVTLASGEEALLIIATDRISAVSYTHLTLPTSELV